MRTLIRVFATVAGLSAIASTVLFTIAVIVHSNTLAALGGIYSVVFIAAVICMAFISLADDR